MKKLIAILVLQIICILALNIPYKTALVFEIENSNQMIAFVPVGKMEEFQITYTHSIHLTEVKEDYKILQNGNIVQTGLVYENYGVGMPSGHTVKKFSKRRTERFISPICHGHFHLSILGLER